VRVPFLGSEEVLRRDREIDAIRSVEMAELCNAFGGRAGSVLELRVSHMRP